MNETAEEEVQTIDPCVETESEDEEHTETYEERMLRYQNSRIEECSDDELWRVVHHGAPTADDPAGMHRRYADTYLENIMRGTNSLLDIRMNRLRQKYEAAAVRNDVWSMDAIEAEMDESSHLRYSI